MDQKAKSVVKYILNQRKDSISEDCLKIQIKLSKSWNQGFTQQERRALFAKNLKKCFICWKLCNWRTLIQCKDWRLLTKFFLWHSFGNVSSVTETLEAYLLDWYFCKKSALLIFPNNVNKDSVSTFNWLPMHENHFSHRVFILDVQSSSDCLVFFWQILSNSCGFLIIL